MPKKKQSGIVKTKDKVLSLHLNFISLQICFVWKAKLSVGIDLSVGGEILIVC